MILLLTLVGSLCKDGGKGTEPLCERELNLTCGEYKK